jgi:signal transduction histidine kinase
MTNHRRILVLIAVALYSATVLVADFITPMGIEVWVLNLPLLLVPILVRSTRMVVGVTLLCTAIVIAGSTISPPGNNPPSWDILNRGMGLGAMLLIAVMARHIINTTTQLDAAMERLRREIAGHIETTRAKAQSEERLRLAVEGAQMGTFDINLRTGRLLGSETHVQMLGLQPTSDGEYPLDTWLSWVHPDDQARVQKARDDALRQRSLYSVEYRIQRADTAAIVWLAVFGCFHYDETGQAVRFTGVSFDITHRKELEGEIRRKELARELLEITNREQQHIGHELHDGVGQELTGLGLMAQTLTQRLPETSAEKRVASRLVGGLNHLHEQLRSLARGLLPVEVESKGLWAALDDLAARTSEHSGVAVTFDCSEWLEMPDHAASVELFRITQEAVSNALRHGRPRSIGVAILSQPAGLCLRIQDDGIGIPDPPATSRGLGIRIMQYRAESIHADLCIKPAAEGGTVVTVILPRRRSNDQGKNGSAAGAA